MSVFAYEPRPTEKLCWLLGAGPLYGYTADKRPGDLLIAADGGLTHAQGMGVRPDILLGDFDSLGSVPAQQNCIVLPREKDDTDMLAAAKEGLRQGYRQFVILGGTGGRADHTLANIQLLGFLKSRGANGWLAAQENVITLLKNEERNYPAGLTGYVSVLAYGGRAEQVTLEGLKYPLQNAVLTPDFPLGTSNAFLKMPARISVGKGSVLVIYPR